MVASVLLAPVRALDKKLVYKKVTRWGTGVVCVGGAH